MNQEARNFVIGLLSILIIAILNYCGNGASSANYTRPSTSVSYSYDKEYESSNYKVAEYKYPTYNLTKQSYDFLDKNKMSSADYKQRGFFYKIYRQTKTDQIARIDEIKRGAVHRTTLIDPTQSGDIAHSRIYIGNRLVARGDYKKNVLIARQKLSPTGTVRYNSKIEYKRKGFVEQWFSKNKQIVYATLFGLHFNPIRYIIFKNGLANRVTEYQYNDHGLIQKEDYYNNGGKNFAGYKVFSYTDQGDIKLAYQYNHQDKLVAMVEYDQNGHEIRIDHYDRTEMVKSYTKVSYSGDGREEMKYDSFNHLVSVTKYNVDGDRTAFMKYDEGDQIAYTESYDFKDGMLRKVEFRVLGQLTRRVWYDENSFIEREEKFHKGDLKGETVYKTNKNGLPISAILYDKNERAIGKWLYTYNNLGQVIREAAYQGKTLISKIENSYDADGNKNAIREYDKYGIRSETEFDRRGRIFKIKKFRGGKLDHAIVRRYKKSGRLAQEELYNKIGGRDRIITFLYDKKGHKIREDGFDSKKQYLGSVKFVYDEQGRLFKTLEYDHLRELSGVTLYDPTGQIIKHEDFKGS